MLYYSWKVITIDNNLRQKTKGTVLMYRKVLVDKTRYKKNNLTDRPTDRPIGKLYPFFIETYAGYILPSE